VEAAYKRSVPTGHRKRSRAAQQNGDKRRFLQLAVSLGLFVLVFLGRNAFPGLSQSWKELITTDVDFIGAVEQFGDRIAEKGSFWQALGQMTAAAFGREIAPPSSGELTTDEKVEEEKIPEKVLLLSETSRHGLDYLFPSNTVTGEAPADEKEEGSAPEIVTAVAQTYNEAGEKLPSNVSYERYELGLEQTVVPVMGEITSGFEYRTSPISGKREFHLALDIAAEEGTPIGAFAAGTVRYIGESDEFGLYLMIDHDNGVATFYAHCSKLFVRKGDPVTCGQTIALVGKTGNATGAHLHFTIEKDNIRLNPAYYVDPT